MKKQLLSIILALLPMLAIADASGSCGDNLIWTYNSTTKTLTIQGNGAMKNYITSFSVPWYSYKNYIQTVIIKDGVTSIGSYAFEDCSSLTSVTIPNSVTSIGGGAFVRCSGLTSVTIPNSVTSIGSDAFVACSGLTSVTIGNSVTSIGQYAFYGCSSLTSITIPNSVTTIGSYAFNGCSGLTSITIPNSVTSIGEWAFWGCSGLTSVEFHCAQIGSWFSGNKSIKEIVIGNEVTGIGYQAFKGCTGITSVTIPNSVTNIGDYAFEDCSSLTSVTIPSSVMSIGSYAFRDCFYLTSITIPNSVVSIGIYAFFNCSGLQKVIVPDIAAWCGINFGNYESNPLYYAHRIYSDENTKIKDLVIPNSVTSIGEKAFSYCSDLTSVTIPNSVTSIGQYAFRNCTGFTSLTIPSSITSIGNSAFSGCSSLTSVEFHCAQIGSWFSGNTSIKNVTIGNGVTSVENLAFEKCSGLTSVTIGNGVTSIGEKAFYGCTGLTSIVVENGNSKYDSRNDCNAIIETASNTLIAGCKNTVIPNSVTSIGYSAFEGCSGLTAITIPSSVTSIGNGAFCGCSGLTSIVVENGNSKYDSRNGCNAIIETASNTLIVGCKTTIIPNSVTSIGSYAFFICSGLTSVTIPNSVTSIGEYAFRGCTGLQSVYSKVEDVFSINENTFDDNTYTTAKLYVPVGKKAAYKGTEAWKQFTNIEEYDFTPKYKLAYMVDGIEYKVYEIAEGAEITPEPAPTKEGYTFSGWSEIPETMPAHDVTVTGSFAVNQYLITYMIGDEVYQKEYVDYGATIVLPNVPEREGYSFAWIDAPEKMPAHDITINGAYTSGMWGVSNDDATTNTYTISGYKTDKPRRGVNIIRMSDGTTRKVVVK